MTNTEAKGHGLIIDEIQPEDYVFGGSNLAQNVFVTDGNWKSYLPGEELQKRNGLETMNCTGYGSLNCIETLLQFHMQDIASGFNYSERYVGVLAGTTQIGNSPHKMAETIRKVSGLIPEEALPFDETITTWDQYYSPNPMTSHYTKQGEEWLKQFDFKHEWVFAGEGDLERKHTQLQRALQASPIGISLYLGRQRNGMYYKDTFDTDNHWATLCYAKENEYWEIFDHYDDVYKKVEWDTDFTAAKRYSVKTRPQEETRTWWERITGYISIWNQQSICKA